MLAVTSTVVVLVASFQMVGPAASRSRNDVCRREGDEIVVCALQEQDEQYRIPAGVRDFVTGEGPPPARIGIGGGRTLGVTTQQVTVGGFPSRRALITITAPF